jgi:hypothetical protein
LIKTGPGSEKFRGRGRVVMIEQGGSEQEAPVDIAHGEPNVVLEWGIVRLGLLILFVLVVASAVCTGLVLKYFHDKDRGEGAKPLD